MATEGQAAPGRMEEYWAKTRTLLWITMILWVFFSFVIHFFVETLNQYTFLGFPLGFYMAAQGSLIAFVLIIFFYAYRQNRIDEEFGVAED